MELRREDSWIREPDRITKLIRMGSQAREIAAVIREEHVDLLVIKLRKRFVFPDLGAQTSQDCQATLLSGVGRSTRTSGGMGPGGVGLSSIGCSLKYGVAAAPRI